jgi:hypothetical protein
MKKLIVINTALALCIGLGLWACGDEGNGGAEDARPEQVEPTDGAEEIAPDPVTEDVPTEQPAEEQVEVVEDPQPDEVIEDTPEEGDGAGGDYCNNADDLAIINGTTVDVQEETTTCATDCYLHHPTTLRQCTADCVVTATGLSADCADCYAGMAECTVHNCLTQCMSDPTSTTCLDCLDTAGCITTFLDCSGLPE